MATQSNALADFGLLEHGDTIQANLDLISSLTKKAFDADGVSVTVIREAKKQTTSHTDDWALELDLKQYESDSGPCLDAIRSGTTVRAPSLSLDTRWEHFRLSAAACGVMSVLSIPLQVTGATIGGLNIYWKRSVDLPDDELSKQEAFAASASSALHNARLYERAKQTVEQLETAMASRAAIEQAKGILAERNHIDPEDAFQQMVTISQGQNKKLRDVAVEIVASAPTAQDVTNN